VATNYPASLDNIPNPTSSNPLSNPSHSEQHIFANTAIEALEAKVGVDGSTDPNSLDYKVSQLEAAGGTTTVEVLGLQGNNDLTVNGIENSTVIDSLNTSVWQSAEYKLKVTQNANIYTSNMSVVFDGTSAYVSETDIITNNDTFTDLANFAFNYSGSIINLTVTPVSGTVSVRFIRTALKK
jgi:hypothetical protein